MGRSRRKKKKTHNIGGSKTEDEAQKHPKTFVMDRGKVGSTLKNLVQDLRKVMEPFTASQLKVTRKNILKDFVNVAGPLGVTHFVMISKTSEFVYFKLAKVPHGPTITFRVTQFSLSREVISSAKKPLPLKSINYLTPAVLVMNGFVSGSKPCQLMSTMLQNMFPTLNVQKIKLGDLRRCVLTSYDKETNQLEFRHYAIKVVPRGMSRGVRKIAQSKLPNLSRYEDISEYVLGGGASESEAEEAEGEVTLGQDVPGRGNIRKQQSSVRLYEIGPRLTLTLIKVEAGLCSGEVLHHELVHRTKEQVRALRKRITEQRRLKELRKKHQEENVRRKKREKELKRKAERIRQGKVAEEEMASDDDDAGWYKEEVGVAPDPELLLSSKELTTESRKRKRASSSSLILPANNHKKKRKDSFDETSRNHKPSRNKAAKKRSKPGSDKHGPPKKKRVVKVSTGTVFRRKAQRTAI